MDYKAALLKDLEEIPSSSVKSKYRQHSRPKNNLQQLWASSISQDPPGDDQWPNLPPKLMLLIMRRIGWYDVLTNVKQVCKYWYMLSKDPSMWRVIEFRQDILFTKLREKRRNIITYGEYYSKVPSDRTLEKALHKMVKHVIGLSRGQLQDLCIQGFGSDNLFKYIYQRARQLRRLRLEDCLVYCYNYESHDFDRNISLKGLIQMLRSLPLLEELELPYTRIFGKGIEIVGRHCPHLKSFTLNQRVYLYSRNPTCDKQALAIAKSMPGLRHLQLFGNRMTVTGLMAILNNCQHLEYLDLRQCYGLCSILDDEPNLEMKLRQQIKHVRFPEDSTEDYEFDDMTYDSDGHIGSDDSSLV